MKMFFCSKFVFYFICLFQSIYCQNFSAGLGNDSPSLLPGPAPEAATEPKPSITLANETQISNSTSFLAPQPIDHFNDDYRIVCYFTNWAQTRPEGGKYIPEDTDAKLCTHINYAFATLDPTSFTIKLSKPKIDIEKRFIERLIGLKKQNPKLKVLLSLGGWADAINDKYSTLIKKKATRRNFINKSVELLAKYQFDGLDVDWIPKCYQGSCETGPIQDKDNFAIFISELRKAFQPKGWLLTAAVSPLKAIIDDAYDVRSIVKDLDYVSVVTYDIPRQWDKFAGHHAPLHPRRESAIYDKNFATYNIYFAINYWIKKGMPKKMINLGVPFFGRSYTLAAKADSHPFKGYGVPSTKGGDKGPFTDDIGVLAYYEVCDNIKYHGWTKARDPSTRSPFAYKGNQWVGYDDSENIRKKSTFIKTLGLGGAMIWTLDFDDFTGRCCPTKWPLLKTLNAELRGVYSYKGIDC